MITRFEGDFCPCFLAKFGKNDGPVVVLDDGEGFDDSLLPGFTSDHYLGGLITCNTNELTSCQFIYKSSNGSQHRIVSPVHGASRKPIDPIHMYEIDDDDRICGAHVTWDDNNSTSSNKTHRISRVFLELQFVTAKGRLIPPYNGLISPKNKCNYGPKYVLRYVTGKATTERITQLQLMWFMFEN
jgi:hypothetical protein